MAHADYNCCAICDEKQDYSECSTTKEEICTDCLKLLRDNNINVLDVGEFIEWIEKQDKINLAIILSKIGYSKCFYGNDVDKLISEKLA
jgi:hypothetical protein